jgi:glycosyltransferase involved in cell wall biosynthesis
MKNIPVVIVAYNRPAPLKRLLDSVRKGVYSGQIKLIISIDGSDNSDVLSIAENFIWVHGEKEIIHHKTNIGLRDHILSCGDLTLKYDGIVLLEDDLYVSPCFYEYAIEAMEFYNEDDIIAGISLYSHRYNETARLPFTPLSDDSDVFFLQIASSWGQAWTRKQWVRFRDWYGKPDSLLINEKTILPNDVLTWPETSWKKYFIKYMVENNLFFVYPQISYTTNFGDCGIHHKATDIFQVPLEYDESKNTFKEFRESMLKYDSFCEILPACLNHFTDLLKDYNYTVDLFGVKPLSAQSEEYVLTTRNCKNPISCFGLQLIPAELNVIENIKGESISFAHKENARDTVFISITNNKFLYYYKFDNSSIKNTLAENDHYVQVISEQASAIEAIEKERDRLAIREKELWAENEHYIQVINEQQSYIRVLQSEKKHER